MNKNASEKSTESKTGFSRAQTIELHAKIQIFGQMFYSIIFFVRFVLFGNVLSAKQMRPANLSEKRQTVDI